jgi:uncharacterized BrkB/YihY/UPF0761 family membrane protein
MERRIGPFFAVLVSLLGGALLMIAVIVFVFYGYCEDYCDKPPRSDWKAFWAALPWALGALGVMTGAVALFMVGPPERRPGFWRAFGVAAVSCVIFCAAFVAFAWLVLGDHEGAGWVVGVPAVLVWEWLTAMVARRFALRA